MRINIPSVRRNGNVSLLTERRNGLSVWGEESEPWTWIWEWPDSWRTPEDIDAVGAIGNPSDTGPVASVHIREGYLYSINGDASDGQERNASSNNAPNGRSVRGTSESDGFYIGSGLDPGEIIRTDSSLAAIWSTDIGDTTGGSTLGSGVMDTKPSNDGQRAYACTILGVSIFDASDGTHLGTESDYVSNVFPDRQNDILYLSRWNDPLAGGTDEIEAIEESSGNHLWSHGMTDTPWGITGDRQNQFTISVGIDGNVSSVLQDGTVVTDNQDTGLSSVRDCHFSEAHRLLWAYGTDTLASFHVDQSGNVDSSPTDSYTLSDEARSLALYNDETLYAGNDSGLVYSIEL